MKKILFATTALVASTSFAMADVDITGEAEMGVFGGQSSDGEDIDPQFHTDINVIFEMSGETDGGLTFGGFVELDSDEENAGAFDPAEAGDDTAIFVSGAFGTITMGDTDGALDFALQEDLIGNSIQDDNEHGAYRANRGNAGYDGFYDGQVARYDYTFGDIAVAASAEIDDEGDGDPVLGVGASYGGAFGGIDFGAGIGYQTVTYDDGVSDIDAEIWGFSLDASMQNGVQAVLNYVTYSGDPAERDGYLGLAAGYEFGAILASVSYGEMSFENDNDITSYSLIGNYDLGGGAQLQAGYQNSDIDGALDDEELYSFGIAMNF